MSGQDAYVVEVKPRCWRVIVPQRGKLTPLVLRETFVSRTEALSWLRSSEGLTATAAARPAARAARAMEALA